MNSRPAPLRLPDPPWIVAHRGASEALPENTLASFRRALDEGAHMIELDLQLTADHELVAVHDWSVEVAGQRLVVEEVPLSQLRPAAARNDTDPCPLLEEVLALVPESVPINLELKRRQADLGLWAEHLRNGLGERRNLLISSFEWGLLERVRWAMPDRPIAPISSRQPHALLRAAESLDAWGVHCHRRLAFSDFITAARASNWPVLVYTVNDARLGRELIDRGAAGLFTDAPGRMLDALGNAASGDDEAE